MNLSETIDYTNLPLSKRAELLDLLIGLNNRKKRDFNMFKFENKAVTFDGKVFREVSTNRVLNKEESERANKVMSDAIENGKNQIKLAMKQVKSLGNILNISKL